MWIMLRRQSGHPARGVRFLVAVPVAILWVVLATAAPAVGSEPGEPPLLRTDPEHIGAVADAYLAAIQARDWVTMAALLAPQAKYQDFTMEYFGREAIDLRGPEAIVDFWRSGAEESATRSVRFEEVKRFVAGPVVVLDLVTHVRASGSFWNLPQPEVEMSATVITFLRVQRGRITHHTDYADYPAALAQIEAQRQSAEAAASKR